MLVKIDFINLERNDTFRRTVRCKKLEKEGKAVLKVESCNFDEAYLNGRTGLLFICFPENQGPIFFFKDRAISLSEATVENIDLYMDYISIKTALTNEGLLHDEFTWPERYFADKYLSEVEEYDLEVVEEKLSDLLEDNYIGFVANNQDFKEGICELADLDNNSHVVFRSFSGKYKRFEAFKEKAKDYLGEMMLIFTQHGKYDPTIDDFEYYCTQCMVTLDTAYKLYKHFYEILARMPSIDYPQRFTEVRKLPEFKKFAQPDITCCTE